MRLAGPLRIVVLVVSVGVTWIVVSILLGGPGSGFPRIQQLFTSWSAVVQSRFTATSTSWVQAILVPQPPE
ncbi:FAM3 metabolism regulating signaling molecule A [Homo sapiens]|uniref:FAM3 metabolism regulating signaling molecule A n=1 Tax=Homo sapiens TaxID=9606 RepID=Q9BU27_HUMAN